MVIYSLWGDVMSFFLQFILLLSVSFFLSVKRARERSAREYCLMAMRQAATPFCDAPTKVAGNKYCFHAIL